MMAESDVVRVAREYREQLVQNEDSALKQMTRQWLKMESGMRDQFELLSAEVEDMKDSGVSVPKQYIYTLRRYQVMLAQLQQNLGDYNREAERIIQRYQKENFILGLDSAAEIIKSTKPTASIWNRVYNDAAEFMVGFAGNGAPLGELLRRDYGEAATEIMDALVAGVGLGKGYREVAKDMVYAMGLDFRRSVLIARTEINRAYRLANSEQYKASGVVTRVLRLCYPPTACLACLEMDGEECPNGICDDHPNGKCTTIVETVGGIRPTWQTGHEWLMEQSEEDQRRIIGAGRYELWKEHGIPLRDMVRMNDNPVWGASPATIPLYELTQMYNINSDSVLNISNPQRSFVEQLAGGEREYISLRDAFGDALIGTDWNQGTEEISSIENTLARLQETYPMQESKSWQYSCSPEKIVVCDYDKVPAYLPKGSADRRLSEYALAQVFDVNQTDGTRLIVIGFRRDYLSSDTLQDVIENRARHIADGSVIYNLSLSVAEATTMHEWGHVLEKHLDNAMIHGSQNAQDYWDWFRTLTKDEIQKGISEYASTNKGEFVAECFLEMQMPNPRPIAVKFWNYMQKVIEEGY